MVPFSFIKAVLPTVLLFLCASSSDFDGGVFLVIACTGLFYVVVYLSVLVYSKLFPGLSVMGRVCVQDLMQVLLGIPTVLLCL